MLLSVVKVNIYLKTNFHSLMPPPSPFNRICKGHINQMKWWTILSGGNFLWCSRLLLETHCSKTQFPLKSFCTIGYNFFLYYHRITLLWISLPTTKIGFYKKYLFALLDSSLNVIWLKVIKCQSNISDLTSKYHWKNLGCRMLNWM